MTFAKKTIPPKNSNNHARKTKSYRARPTKPKLLHENVVESPREAQGKQEDQAKAAERFADWFLMDFGIRG
jgi:hypothetical protein